MWDPCKMNPKEQDINYNIRTNCHKCTPLRIIAQKRINLPRLEMWNLQTSLAILGTLCFTAVSGYKNGKVEKSCESMMPEHHSQPNTTASPYTLTVNASKFSPGVDIRGEGGNKTQRPCINQLSFLPIQMFWVEQSVALIIDSSTVHSHSLWKWALWRLSNSGPRCHKPWWISRWLVRIGRSQDFSAFDMQQHRGTLKWRLRCPQSINHQCCKQLC